jgi:hypothetical protein
MHMALQWTKKLSALPLCVPPESCPDDYMVNTTAISDDGSRAVGGTYFQHYLGTTRVRTDGTFGTYCYDTAGAGTRLWADEYQGNKGIYAVAISGDGTVAAGGGLLTKGRFLPFQPKKGLLRAFDVATGNRLLDSSNFPDRVNAVSLSRNGSVLAAVAESRLYVFLRSATGLFSTPPQMIDLDGYSQSVAVHPSGNWLAACDQLGNVYVFTITAGVVDPPATWTALEPINPTLLHSLKFPVKFNFVSVSRAGDFLTAGGGNFVYLFTVASLQSAIPGPVARYTSFDASGGHNVRFVAISDNGGFVTTVVNDEDAAGNGTGRLIKLSPAAGVLNEDWRAPLHHLPNTTSIDSSGTRITAADGYPDNVPGTFYLFDNTGVKLWEHATAKMNWPLFISANGSGMVGGSDDNSLFFFTP